MSTQDNNHDKSPNSTNHRFTARLGNKDIIIETGKLAEQAGGAVTVRMGDTVLLATATMSSNVRPGMDFFPLSVDYEERLYAAGRIPIRRTGDGALPYDGSTTDGDWTGYIPFEELPNLYNPPDGLIVTANQRIVGTSYKYTQMSRDAGSPWRAISASCGSGAAMASVR